MAGNAPFDYIDPAWLTGAGAVFDDNSFTNGSTHSSGSAPIPSSFTSFEYPHTPVQMVCSPQRRHHDPALAPSPPASPTRTRLDPTAQSFTPKHGQSRLKVETNIPQEPATSASATPRTPRIEVSPAEDFPTVSNNAAVQAVRQLSRSRRQSSPGRRPVGVQRQNSHSGRRQSLSARSNTGTPMARVVSAPSRTQARVPGSATDRQSMSTPQIQAQPTTNPLLAPVQPMSPATWLRQAHNVGYASQLHHPQPAFAGTDAPRSVPAPRPADFRSRASTQGSGPIVCNWPGCRHRAQGKTFKTPGEFRKHERNHLPESERPHGCTVLGCPRRFFWPKDVERHYEVVHRKSKVECEHCGAQLCREDDLERHVRTAHYGQRNWAAPSPSASSVTSFAMTPRSEYSFSGMPSTPPTGSSFASASRARVQRLTSFNSIPEDEDDVPGSVPMMKSLTR